MGTMTETPNGAPNLDMTALKRLAEIDARRAEIDREDKKLLAERQKLEPALIDQFGQCGMQNIRIDDSTVYMRMQTWAKASGVGDACAALRAGGLGEFVKEGFNSSQLSSFFREKLKGADTEQMRLELLEPFKGTIVLEDKFALASRKSA